MPWNKLYRADLAKQLQFDVQYTLGEGLQFVLDYIALLGQTVPEFGYRVMTSPLTFMIAAAAGHSRRGTTPTTATFGRNTLPS